MDLLIEKQGVKTKLSDFGLFLIDVVDDDFSIERDRQTLKNRNGYLPSKNYVRDKLIRVSAKLNVSSLQELETTKNNLNALLMSPEPIFIRKMLPIKKGFYDFELPGSKSNFDLEEIETKELDYGYFVWLSNAIQYTFLGKKETGLLYNLVIEFTTDMLPYAQTKPINEVLSGGEISYKGNAECSQLEYLFYFKLTADQQKAGNFKLKVGSKEFIYKTPADIKSGDVFLLKGFENLLNGLNINNRTNYQYFVLEPSANDTINYTTDFPGKIELINKVEFYY